MFPIEIAKLARRLVDEARRRSVRLVTAESCTGGLVAGAICQVPGASVVLDRGFVTYSNRAKSELLGVPEDLIAEQGAVSEPVARLMAEGALARADAQLAVAITGVAGPGGGSPSKPVGTVHFATAYSGHATLHRVERFECTGRDEVQLAAVRAALENLLERLS